MDGLYYFIEQEWFRYDILGVAQENRQPYHQLANDDDVMLMRYKLQTLVEDAANYLNVVVGPLPQKGRVEEPDYAELRDIGIPKAQGPPKEGNHFWLAILDTHSGELFDHDSYSYLSGNKVLTQNLQRNINRLYAHFDLHLPEVKAPIEAERHDQTNTHDCGFIALNIMLQFIICRIGASKELHKGAVGKKNPAAQLYTPADFSAEKGGALDLRRALNSIVHIANGRGKEVQFTVEPIEREKLIAAVADEKFFRVPSRGQSFTGTAWIENDPRVSPFDEACQADFLRLAEKMETAMGMTLGLVDPSLGHRSQLEYTRYLLEHAGGVLFSFKRPPAWLGVARQECLIERCTHLIDILPIPRNCMVVLQP